MAVGAPLCLPGLIANVLPSSSTMCSVQPKALVSSTNHCLAFASLSSSESLRMPVSSGPAP